MGDVQHAFVRVEGGLADLEEGLEVMALCVHGGLGDHEGPVTEALVRGPDVVRRLREAHPRARLVTPVRGVDWVHECIVAASCPEELAPPGLLAVFALRAPDEELFLVEHPRALSAASILRQLAAFLGTAVRL